MNRLDMETEGFLRSHHPEYLPQAKGLKHPEVSTVSVPLGIVVARRTLARFFPVGTLGCLLDSRCSVR